jgi:hypothetical protein
MFTIVLSVPTMNRLMQQTARMRRRRTHYLYACNDCTAQDYCDARNPHQLPDQLFIRPAGGHQKVIGDAGRVLKSGSGDRIPVRHPSVARVRDDRPSRRGKEPQ